MTWDELKEEAKKMDTILFGGGKMGEIIAFIDAEKDADIYFYESGRIEVGNMVVARNRTPDQMFAIMKALQ